MRPEESRIIKEMKEAIEDLRKSLGREPQPKEPQYLYVYFNKIIHSIDLFGSKGTNDKYEYMGKIKLEDTEND